jgi:hypothetical protein
MMDGLAFSPVPDLTNGIHLPCWPTRGSWAPRFLWFNLHQW